MWVSRRHKQFVTKREKKNRPWIRIIFGVIGIGVILTSLTMVVLNKKDAYISPLPKTLASVKNIMKTPSSPTNDLEKELSTKHIPFSKAMVASESSYIVVLGNGEEVFFSQKKNIASQVASLQLILSRLTIEGKGFRKLDLRFEKPVVIFSDIKKDL